MKSTGKQIGAAGFWSILGRSGRFLLGLLSTVIVVRGLGDYNYGVLSIIRSILMFAVIMAGAGLGQALLKFLPSLRIEADSRGSEELVKKVFLVQLLVWGLLLAISFLCRDALDGLFAVSGIGKIVFIALSLAVFELLFTLMTHVLNANYDTKLMSLANIIAHVTYIGFLFILMGKLGVIGVVAAAAAGNLLASCILLGRVRRHLKGAGSDTGQGGIGGTRLLKFSLPFAVIGILNIIVWRQSETLFLAHYSGPRITGYFDLAYRLPQTMLEFIPATVWPIIMAGFAESYARDRGKLVDAIEKYYKVLFILCAPISIFGMILGGKMVEIFFGAQMVPASHPAQIFFGIFTVSFFATPLSMSLYVMEKSFTNMLIYLFLAFINVGLDILLIPRYGLAGAIIPVAIVILVSPFIYRAVVLRYLEKVRIPFDFILKCFLASAPMVVLLPLAKYVDSLLSLSAAMIIALMLTVFGFRITGVLREEEQIIGFIPIPLLARLVRFVSGR